VPGPFQTGTDVRAVPEINSPDEIDALWAELTAPPPSIAREKAKRKAKSRANRAKRAARRHTKKQPLRRRKWRKAGPISHARLLELLEYHPAEGRFVFRADRTGGCKAGETAGCPGGRVNLLGRVYPFAKLVHFYQTGRWPGRPRPPTGGRGVYRRTGGPHAKPFAARIRVDGVVRALGTHATEADALATVAAGRATLLGDAKP
jgi:hypothetical protein